MTAVLRALKRLAGPVQLGAVLLALSMAGAAAAAEPIEGDWLFVGSTVHVAPTGPGTWTGVVAAGYPNQISCAGPGTEAWSALTGGGLAYSGEATWFTRVPCAPIGRGRLTITLAGPGSGQACSYPIGLPDGFPQCFPISRPACANAADDDFDRLVDLADPGCESAGDTSEGPDPYLSGTGVRVTEGPPGRVTSVPVELRLSPLATRPVTFTVHVDGITADAGTDFRYNGPATMTLAPGAPGATVTVDVLGDAVYESTEVVEVVIIDVVGAVPQRPRPIPISITDDDPLTRRPTSTKRPTRPGRGTPDSDDSGKATLVPCWPGAGGHALEVRHDVRKIRAGVCPKVRRRSRAGSAGVDRLGGRAGGDVLKGLGGNDTISGGGGADRLLGGRGDDTLRGGPGIDQIDGGDGDDRVDGGPGNDVIVEARLGDDYLVGGPGNDVIVASHGDDHIKGGPGDDIISGGSGKDHVDCGPGNDTLFVNLVADRRRSPNCERILEEPDIPQRHCSSGQGTRAGELVIGTNGGDTCRANGGDDLVEGKAGNDRLFGGAGADELFGRKGHDKIFGGQGNDFAEGGRGNDTMDGGAGNDTLIGGYDRDRLAGGPGNDTLNPGWGSHGEVADCGPGEDTFIYGPGDRAINCEHTKKPG